MSHTLPLQPVWVSSLKVRCRCNSMSSFDECISMNPQLGLIVRNVVDGKLFVCGRLTVQCTHSDSGFHHIAHNNVAENLGDSKQ